MMSDAEYNRLYASPAETTKGRANRAALLIRNGRASSRAYDDCFEQGDGQQVLARLMQRVRADDTLRRLMQAQGAWSDSCQQVPEPEPLTIGEAERIEGFRRATGGMQRARQRWQERSRTGLTDAQLADALAFELGSWGGSADPDGLCLTWQAAGLKIWITWEITNHVTTAPTFQGKVTIAMARQVYSIKDPSERQLAMF